MYIIKTGTETWLAPWYGPGLTAKKSEATRYNDLPAAEKALRELKADHHYNYAEIKILERGV